MLDRVFFKIHLGSREFLGILTKSGPFIHAARAHFPTYGESMPLGCATYIAERTDNSDSPSWWLAKYGTQPMISLQGLRATDLAALSDAFGIEFYDHNYGTRKQFYDSPAFFALADWVREHPRAAATSAMFNPHLPTWRERASAAARLLPVTAIQ
jgi:hypothetical protein